MAQTPPNATVTYADAGVDNLWSLFYYTDKPSWNLSYWNNPQYQKLIDQASAWPGFSKGMWPSAYWCFAMEESARTSWSPIGREP
ncbi:MAG: hypothetical protein LAO09_14575, partial [Acidobacteriia bacterium]|nr:hypothetical protein [Terriglobia bacterium]